MLLYSDSERRVIDADLYLVVCAVCGLWMCRDLLQLGGDRCLAQLNPGGVMIVLGLAVFAARKLSADDVTAALKTYMPSGQLEDYVMFASSGHGGSRGKSPAGRGGGSVVPVDRNPTRPRDTIRRSGSRAVRAGPAYGIRNRACSAC